jgi:hypothetical protein
MFPRNVDVHLQDNPEKHNLNTLCRGNLKSYKEQSIHDSAFFTPDTFLC